MIKYLEGNCIDKMKELEDNSIDCVVSSPPYFGLRDYGTAQWQGGDSNCDHIANPNATKKQGNPEFNKDRPSREETKYKGYHKDICPKCGAKRIDEQFGLEKTYQDYLANTVKVFETFKPKLKDTATIWWNVGDSYSGSGKGWSKSLNKNNNYSEGINSGIIYDGSKPKDLLMIPNRVAIALQEAGWWVRSEIIWHKPNPMPESVRDRPTSCHEKIWLITKNKKYYYDADAIRDPTTDSYKGKRGLVKKRNKTQSAMQDRVFNTPYHPSNTKNKRNVWTITTKPFRGAHFATFPKDLIEPCIKAGCPEGGIVLDPFAGAGTTGLVAKENNRNAILIELNGEYLAMAKKRIETILV